MNYQQSLSSLTDAIMSDGDIAPDLAIYRDGYHERLQRAVRDDYPALAYYLGEKKFNALTEKYIRVTPSRHWDLNQYSVGFAEFITPYCDPSALSLAALESAITQCFWAVEENFLVLETLTAENLQTQILKLRSNAKLLKLNASANDYLTAYRNNDSRTKMRLEPEMLLVIRHENEVKRYALDNNEYELLTLLDQEIPFGEALENMPELSADALQYYMKNWCELKLFAA